MSESKNIMELIILAPPAPPTPVKVNLLPALLVDKIVNFCPSIGLGGKVIV